MSKAPTLPALGGLGGSVGGSERAGAGERSHGFAEPGNMKWVDCYNHRGCVPLAPFHQV